MGDFINTLGTGSHRENLVLLDEVSIDKKECQSTFMYCSNSGLRRLSEDVAWAWKKAWPREGTPKKHLLDIAEITEMPKSIWDGQCSKERVSFSGIPSLILHEH